MRNAIITFVLLLAAGCMNHVNNPVNQTGLPVDTLGLHYELLTSFTHSQTTMLTGQSDKLFIYGYYAAIKVYNLTSRQLTEYPPQSDSITWRWDGAIALVNNLIYVIAYPVNPSTTYPRFYKIITLDPTTLAINATAASLPFSSRSDYPAFTAYNNKIFVLFSTLDSLYMFDPGTLTGRFVTDNKSKGPDGFKYYSFGLYQNYFYIYRRDSRAFYRINLDTYAWEPISIPANVLPTLTGNPSVASPQFVGGMMGNKFCLWQDPLSLVSSNYWPAITYDVTTSIWAIGSYNAAYTNFSDPNFYQTDTALYVANAGTNNLWKITQVH